MSEHTATVRWERPEGVDDGAYVKGRYSRAHEWAFDGGLTVAGSPAPGVVPAPWSDAGAVDPEEALVASASSCHMLTFLWIASKAGYAVVRYRDDAAGTMSKNADGAMHIGAIALRVRVEYSGDRVPSEAEEMALHHKAHELCPIAHSIVAEVTVFRVAAG